MDQRVKLTLAIQADTAQAKAAMQELNNSFNSVFSTANKQQFMGQPIQKIGEAKMAAAQLQAQLQNAFNVDTGKLNLTAFNNSLKNSGKDLNYYRQQLVSLGPEGAQSFAKVTQAIATADVSTKRSIGLVDKMKTSLMNVGQYLISTNILRGLMSAVSGALQYTKELNTSLNDIRIVTGYSADQMERFAIQANKAAKSLSTTTNEYAKASLIFYQQGLSDSEVKERTAATIKMANVSGQSAETVSDQLTAIWNNFDNGSKSLEYYVDVVTALGAATASSSEEIATGLEKFAAVAETVGLSYEYATAALATVTATTRQSADVVGTAFKTLFARIQDLELGNSLDDGVTLGKYSQALKAIDVDILDATGNVKDMNNILDEMGAKWDNLTQAQKISTAQTVAGVRQYTQLIALMDNWDYFQENISVAETSEGELSKQQKIYEESWDAASKNAKAALEEVYNTLLDDDFFITLTQGFADFLGVINEIGDTIDGLKGVFMILGSVILKTFGPQIITSFKTGLMSLTEPILHLQRKKNEVLQQEAGGYLNKMTPQEMGLPGEKSAQAWKNLTKTQQDANAILNSDKATEEQKDMVRIALQEQRRIFEETVKAEKELIQATRDLANSRRSADKERGFEATKEVAYTNAVEETGAVNRLIARASNLGKSNVTADNLDVKMEKAKAFSASLKDGDSWGQAVKDMDINPDGSSLGLETELNNLDNIIGNESLDANTKAKELENTLRRIMSLTEEGSANAKDNIMKRYAEDSVYAKQNIEEFQQELAELESKKATNMNKEAQAAQLSESFGKKKQGVQADLDKIAEDKKILQSELDGLEADEMLNREAHATASFDDLDAREQVKRKEAQLHETRKFYGNNPEGAAAIETAQSELDAAMAHQVETQEKLNVASKKHQESQSAAAQTRNKMTALTEKEVNLNKELDKYTDAQNRAEKERAQHVENIKQDEAQIAKYKKEAPVDSDKIGDISDSIEGEVEALGPVNQDLETMVNSSKEGAENMGKLKNQLLSKPMGMTEALTSVASTAMMAISAYQSLSSAWKTLTDETATTGEKVTAVVTGLSMALMTLGMAFNKSSIEAYKSIGISIWNTSVKAAEAVSIKLATKATDESTKSVAANALAFMAHPIFWLVAIIAGVVVAIIGLVHIFKKFTDTLSENEKELKKVQENLEKLETSIQSAKEANEQFIASYDKYDQAVKNLKTLEEGTDEYKKAVIEANEEARNLIETYGLWGKYKIENGVITFNEGVYDDIIKQQQEGIAAQQTRAGILDIKQADLETEIGFEGKALDKKIDQALEKSDPDLNQQIAILSAQIQEISNQQDNPYVNLTEEQKDNLQAEKEKLQQELEKLIRVSNTYADISASGFNLNDTSLISQNWKELRQKYAEGGSNSDLLKILFPDLDLSKLSKDEQTIYQEYFNSILDQLIPLLQENTDAINENTLINSERAELITYDFVAKQAEQPDSKIRAEKDSELYNDIVEMTNTLFQQVTSEEYQGKTYVEALKDEEDKISKAIDETDGFKDLQSLGLGLEHLSSDTDYARQYASLYGIQGELYASRDEKGQIIIKDAQGKTEITMTEEDLAEAIASGLKQKEVEEHYSGLVDFSLGNQIRSQTTTSEAAQAIMNGIAQAENGKIDFDFTKLIGSVDWSGAEGFKALYQNQDQEKVLENLGINETLLQEIEKQTNISMDKVKDAIFKGLNSWTEEDAYQRVLASGASELDISEDALAAYTKSLQKNNEALKEDEIAATQAAIASLKYSKNVEKTEDALKKVRDAEEGSLEYYQAFGDLTNSLEEQVGLDLSTFDNFDTILEEVGKAAADSSISLDSLRETLGKLILENAFDLKTSEGKQAYEAILSSFLSLSKELKPGDTKTLTKEEQDKFINYLKKTEAEGLAELMQDTQGFENMDANQIEAAIGDLKNGYLSQSAKDIVTGAASYIIGGSASFDENGLLTVTKEKSNDTKELPDIDKKRYRDEFELYKKENEIIEKNNHLLELSEKQRAGLYGQEYLDNLKEEITLLQNNNAALLDRKNLMKAQLNISTKALRDGGIKVDDNGNIINRQAQEQAALDAYNASQASTSESTREAGKIAYEKFKQLLADYDEDLKNLRDTELEILENKQKEAELALEKIEHYYDLIEQRLKNSKSLLELEKTIYENTQGSEDKNPLFIFKNLIDNTELDFEQVLAGYNQLKELQASPYLYDENGNMTEWGKKALQEAFDNGINYITAIYEAKTAIYEEFTSVLEDQLSSMDENIDAIETYINIASGWQDVLEKSNLKVIRTYKQTGEEAQETADAIDELNNDIQKNIIESNTKQLQAQKAEYQAVLATQRLLRTARQEAASAGDEELTAFYDKQLESVNKSANEYLQNIQSLLQSTMDAITENFKSQIDQIMTDFESSLSDYQDLDTLQERYDQFNQKQDRYLSSLEKEYELNKLNREIESKINSDNTSLLAKSKLLKIQEEINDLQSSGVKMSEYDLKVLQQQYDLELARIALEEAQNAKNSMRLVRGENGQWRYAFTADEQAISNAEQKVEDAEHALAKTNEEQLEKIQGDIIKTEKEASDAIGQIYQDLADGKYETYEDFLEDLTSTTEFYQAEIDYLYKELNKVLGNADISFKKTFLGMNTDYKNTSEASKAWKENTNKAVEEAQGAWEEYQKKMSEITTDVTGDGDTLEEEITDNLDEIEKGVEALAKTTQTEATNFTNSMETMANSVSAFAKIWREEYLPIVNSYGKEIEDTGSSLEEESDVNAQEKAKQNMQKRSLDWWFSNETDQSSLEVKNYEEGTKAGFTLDKATGIWYYDADKTQQVYKMEAPSREEVVELYMQGSIGIKEIQNYLNNTGHHLDEFFLEDLLKKGKISQKVIDELKKHDLVLQFDTGGYTGSWGNKDGRLALLHEKELVLNKSDTKNILDAVSLVRQISESIKQSVFANAGATASFLGRISNVRLNEQPHEIQQNVHIEASFPNVKDASEIEYALNNLVNDAVQYTGLR